MRILLYGMQSSGASVIAYMLAQKPDCLAFVDIWNMYAAPEFAAEVDCVAKVVVTTAYSLELHRKRFRPDLTILALRHPCDNYDSLFGKSYANEAGLIDEKFALLEDVFHVGANFDAIVNYEDFVFQPRAVIDQFTQLGWQFGQEALLFQRSPQQIQEANLEAWPEADQRLKYGVGNIQGQGVLRNRIRFAEPWGRTEHLPATCPSLLEYYSGLCSEKADCWHVPSFAILSCDLGAILRGSLAGEAIPPRSEYGGYDSRLVNGNAGCKVNDRELLLYPAPSAKETRLSVARLPGKPFNRVRGSVCTESPFAPGTLVKIRVETAAQKLLAEQAFTLRHSDMRQIDLAFQFPSSTITLSLCVSVENVAEARDDSSVCFRDLRLEQALL